MSIGVFLFLSYLTISYIVGAIISMSIILENRDPARTVTWLLIFILLPGIGLVIYAILGRNMRKRKLFKTQKLASSIREEKVFENLERIEEIANTEQSTINTNQLLNENIEDYSKKRVISLLLNTGKLPFTTNNKVSVYIDGNQKFKNLLEDIKNAKNHIHLEYFIIKDSEIGRELKDLLIKKSNEGVKIRILYDDVGCWRFWFYRKFFNEMKENGIEIVAFLPAKFPLTGGKLNYRNHRKIAIIDGKIGYTGGLNIGDEYMGKNKKFGYWRDTHIKIEGTSVYMLQMIFLTDWYYTTKEIITEDKYFPSPQRCGNSMVQIIASGPDSDWESIRYAYFSAICQAKKSIYIETPYFIPDESILIALKSAALSGVDVRIVFPKIADHKIVNNASYSYFDDILKSGGKVYLYTKGFIHSKIMTIDDKIASTGSANMDLRSFMLNFEINAFIYDKKIVERMNKDFFEDLNSSEELTLDEFSKRKLGKKVRESIARLFSPIL
ncbi:MULTISPECIES: cardiolipin synthase [Romboutsia]|uniref:Cardiolipin synthase n=2 Tax=Romboutsia TaxID=1501226 RepID=A0A2P2BV02_9FIRM|nr:MULTISPECIES: cardiolipin synthase [Romboutsia]MCH1959025.1 cardiolipin synthase [Romboutsia hominis]MCH1968148.1 cardiolipin synthase [Romboutsia hominis]MDB8805877.1 cardiolipin synthase [Romboutsia sp. 1001216sp1]MDB8808328.1 cardiolipin synthase [Romboutsia sp. 1001216sp1]MDB8811630.1 cardiolipin synthase [Romboutsia sp. 1001216sp1]